MGQYYCNQCQSWMDSSYAGSDTHMRSHLFGSDNRQNSNGSSSSGIAGLLLTILTLVGIYKFFEPYLKPRAEKFMEGKEWGNCPSCGRLNRGSETCRCKGQFLRAVTGSIPVRNPDGTRTPVRILCYSPLPPKTPPEQQPQAKAKMSVTVCNFSICQKHQCLQERKR